MDSAGLFLVAGCSGVQLWFGQHTIANEMTECTHMIPGATALTRIPFLACC
jgi:hypothetical protein